MNKIKLLLKKLWFKLKPQKYNKKLFSYVIYNGKSTFYDCFYSGDPMCSVKTLDHVHLLRWDNLKTAQLMLKVLKNDKKYGNLYRNAVIWKIGKIQEY